MKGTLFSVDFVEESNGNPRFLEMNTDTYVYDDFLNNECDWSGLITLLQSESIDTVSVVYKPDLHLNVVNHLSESLNVSASFITTFTKHEELLHDIYPTPIVDASNKFILRLAYDENAIVDSTYAKTDLNALKLFYDYTASNDCVPFYYSSSDVGEINTLSYSLNGNTIPDITRKSIEPYSVDRVKFIKLGAPDSESTGSEFDTTRILNYMGNSSSSFVYSNYLLSSESISNNIASSLRYYGIVYGSDLETLHLGETRLLPAFTLPTEEQLNRPNLWTETMIDSKHHYEYSTSPAQKEVLKGIYETETVLLNDDTTISVTEIVTGSVVKAMHIPTLPDESNIASANYFLWSHSGNQLPSGSAITSSVVQAISTQPFDRFMLTEISISGSDEIYATPSTPLLVYCSSSDEIRFKQLSRVDVSDDYAIGTNNSLVPIDSIKYIILNENSGSLYDLNVEPVDNFLIGEVSYFSGIFHNKKFI